MDEYIFLLKNSAIFAGVKEDEILTMLHCLNAVKASKKKDSYILRAGEHTDSMGMLLSGSAPDRTGGHLGTPQYYDKNKSG